ncbi:MAG: BON domain-containing protein [Thermoanaerobaculia bacterium]|nr:BON domain-containing protein [Thermoanaerobaculia bacterium]
MKMKSLTNLALIGAFLIAGQAAFAADNQADWTITLKVKLALLDKLGSDSLHVDVTTDAGALTLAGTVDKRETRELAETVAKTVPNIKSVKNSIELKTAMVMPGKVATATGEAEAEVKDAMLETRIRIALVEKMSTDGFRIGTEAASGVVTLEFNRDFTTARRAEATKIVKAVEGVTKVVSVDKKS